MRQGKGKREKPRLTVVIGTRHVTLTVFYAMASLAMTSFLYGSLAGEAGSEPASSNTPSAWAVAALLPYGVAFGLSVLMLFYGLTLVMLERGLDREAGWAYWVVACAGPAVVLRFLLAAAGAAQEAISGHPPDGLLSRWAMFWWVLGAAVVAAAVMLVGLDWWWFRWLRDLLGNRPAVPAVVVFVLVSVITGLASPYFTGRPLDPKPQPWIVTVGLWGSVAAVAVFAFACGCVIGPRVRVSLPPRISRWRRQRNEERTAFMAGAVRARGSTMYIGPDAVFMVCLPDGQEKWGSAAPVLSKVFELLGEYGGDRLGSVLTATAEWDEAARGWPRLLKLRLDFSGAVTDTVSVVMNLARVRFQNWDYAKDGGAVAITTRKRLRRTLWRERSSWTRDCVRLGPARRIRTGT